MNELINHVRINGYIKLESRNEAIRLVMAADWEGYRFGYKEEGNSYKVALL